MMVLEPSTTPIEWVALTVNVEKDYIAIRICGDFQILFKYNMISHTTLLPTFGKLTSKIVQIDFQDTYKKIEVAEED